MRPSLSDLSTSFQQCFQSINQNRKVVKVKKSKEPSDVLQIKPFHYEAARKRVKFGEDAEEESGSQVNSAGKKKSSAVGRLQIDNGTKQFPQARWRRQSEREGSFETSSCKIKVTCKCLKGKLFRAQDIIDARFFMGSRLLYVKLSNI